MDGIGMVSTNLPQYADDQSMTSVKLKVFGISKLQNPSGYGA
jgi:hypothetical protein